MDQQPTNDSAFRPDPVTGEPSAATVGLGTGAVGGGLAGATVGGAVAGPVGVMVGGVAGAVAGAYGGTRIADTIYPPEEEQYWGEHHGEEEWAEKDSTYDQYAAAYRTGYQAYQNYGDKPYEEIEPQLEREYSQSDANRVVSWSRARPALKAAWRRASGMAGTRKPGRGIRSGM